MELRDSQPGVRGPRLHTQADGCRDKVRLFGTGRRGCRGILGVVRPTAPLEKAPGCPQLHKAQSQDEQSRVTQNHVARCSRALGISRHSPGRDPWLAHGRPAPAAFR